MNKRRRYLGLFVVVWLVGCDGDKPGNENIVGSGWNDSGVLDTEIGDTSLDNDARNPVDLVEFAPRLDPSVATSFYDAVEFLFSGESPIQTGVASGVIDPERVAVMRGRVVSVDGNPIEDTRVAVFGHDQYGQTMTRADGWYDLAVNGGETLTLRFEGEGYLTVDRPGDPQRRDYLVMPDIVLTELDIQATNISFSNAPTMQVARGTVIEDKDGARQGALLAPAAVQAEMWFSDGTTKPLLSGTIRITEYTVGESGPSAMPAPLPSNTGYTYAMELSADEAIAQGAQMVRFSTPLIYYVENFLGFPDGSQVPSGYYDREQGRWLAEPDGRVIRVLSLGQGRVELDTDGDGSADSEAVLASLGIDAEELEHLAQLFQAGQSLWRVPISHFSPHDLNWWLSQTPEAQLPSLGLLQADPRTDCANEVSGSIIECENRTLGERVDIGGTSLSLNYRSDRVPGRISPRSFTIPITTGEVTPELKGIELEVQVAGQVFQQSFEPEPNLEHRFVWDGFDAYQRRVQGSVTAHVSVSYLYDVTYVLAPRMDASFGQRGEEDSGVRARELRRRVRRADVTLRPWSSLGLGLGGWSLDVHHQYDVNGKVLYLGDGRRRGGEGAQQLIAERMVDFSQGIEEAEGEYLHGPEDIALSASGELYVLRRVDDRGFVYRMNADGEAKKIAGCRWCEETADGGRAIDTMLEQANALAVAPDGAVYVAERRRLRRIRPDGIIETIAGNGKSVSLDVDKVADGQLATEGPSYPRGIALMPDGRVVFVDHADYGNTENYIRSVDTEGIISTIAVLGIPDGYDTRRVRLGPDGALYAASFYGIFRVTDGGDVERVSDECCDAFPGDGSVALVTYLDPADVAALSDGSVLVASDRPYIYRIGPNGLVHTYAGSGYSGPESDFALATRFRTPRALLVDAAENVWIADKLGDVIFRLRDQLPGLGEGELMIASEDGRQLYEFSERGKHLRTLDAYTGEMIYAFGYASNGKLSEVNDPFGNITKIERAENDDLKAIIAPFGQRTELSTNNVGYLSSMTNPLGNRIELEHGETGLLNSLVDERGGRHRFSYDEEGLLDRDEAPQPEKNGYQELSESGFGRERTVTLSSAEGRSTVFDIEEYSWRSTRTITDSAGFETKTERRRDGSYTVSFPDDTTVTGKLEPDPRWLGQAPYIKEQEVRLPSGLKRITNQTTSIQLSDDTNALTLQSLTTQYSVNGNEWTETRDMETGTVTLSSPEDREMIVQIDDYSRVKQIQMPGLYPQTIEYDSRGRLQAVRATGDGETREAVFVYDDVSGYLKSIASGQQVAKYTTDALGRVLDLSLPGEREVGHGYDPANALTSLTPPSRPAHEFTYTALGLPESYVAPAPNQSAQPAVTTITRDRDGLITRVDYPDGRNIEISRLPDGRPDTMTVDTFGQVRYAYSQQTGQLASVNAPGDITVDVEYDGPFLKQMGWKHDEQEFGSVRRVLDGDFRLEQIEVNDETVVDYSYDADGLIMSAGDLEIQRDDDNGVVVGTILDEITTTTSRNGFGEYQIGESKYGDRLVYSEQVTDRDDAGRILTRKENIEGESHDFTYSYDTAGRLSSVIINGTTTAEYQYDSNGNRQRRQSASGVEEGSYDQQDRLLHYGTRDYQFNESGQLESVTETSTNSTTRYQYGALGNLRTVNLSDGREITYEIDGFNRRIGKRINGSISYRLLYQDNLRPIAILDGDNAVVATFIYATHAHVPDYVVRDRVTYRIITDHLGSVHLVVNAGDGTVSQRIEYDEYGRVLNDTNPGFQPFGFAGGLYDRDTGLTRFGARDYDAYTGRWTTKDPILFAGGDANLYGYVIGDPVNLIDPNGLWLVQTTGGLFGAGAQALTNYNAYICGRISGADYALSIGIGFGVGVLSTLPTGIVGGALAGSLGSGINEAFNVGIGAKNASLSDFRQAVALGGLAGFIANGLGKIGGQLLKGEKVIGERLPLAPRRSYGELGGAIGTGIGTSAATLAGE